MPTITYEADLLTKEKKVELIKILTQSASKITATPEQAFTVLIKENPIENWGIGGIPLDELMKAKSGH